MSCVYPIRIGRTIRYRFPKGSTARELQHLFHASRADAAVRSDGDRWIAFELMNRPVEALQQSYLRTKAAILPVYKKRAAQGQQLEQYHLRR